MGFMMWMILVIIGLGIFYAVSHPEIVKYPTFTNPFSKSQNASSNNNTFSVYNNVSSTPYSIITQTPTQTNFGKPWTFYSCQSNEDCHQSFLAGTFCNITTGECYAKK